MNRVTCITPSAPGRDKFLERCVKYVKRFDVDCEHLIITSDNMHENVKKLLTRVETELVAFIEDDDWYHKDYLKTMIDQLDFARRHVIGYDPTVYYHLWHTGYRVFVHPGRASLFTTVGYTDVIRKATEPALADTNRPLIDIELWRNLARSGVIGVTTVGKLALGIKHNIGLCEGNGHIMPKNSWTPDSSLDYFKSYIGQEDAEDYEQLKKELINEL